MKRYKCVMLSASGETVVREIAASNEQGLRTFVKQEKLTLLTSQEIDSQSKVPAIIERISGPVLRLIKGAAVWATRRFTSAREKVSERSLCLFTRQMAALLAAGVNINGSIRTIIAAESDEKFRGVLGGIAQSMEEGIPLVKCFAQYPGIFSKAYVGLLEVGAASGMIPSVLEKHASDLEKIYSYKRKIIASLTYPATILIFALIAIFIMMIYFVPSFTSIYSEQNMKLPVLTSILVIIVSSVLDPLFWIVFIAVVAIVFFFIKNYQNTIIGCYNRDYVLMRLPITGGLIASMELYQIYMNLACMLQCGVHISDALKILKDMCANGVLREFLERVLQGLKSGATLYQMFQNQWFIPRFSCDLIQTGESTGDLARMIRKSAEMLEEQVNHRLEAFLHIIEPVIICFLAFVVGFILIATFLPLYNMITAFS